MAIDGRRRLGIIAAACALGVMFPGPAAAVPLPTQDPFYAIPAGLSGIPNGTVLDSRPIEAKALLAAPMPAAAWQVKYKTIDNHGQASAYVATVLVPHQAWRGPGPRPLVSYQTAEDGVGAQCAASYALRGGLTFPPANSLSETAVIAAALQQGWALVVPDYQGPRSEFTGAAGSAHGILDGIRAARQFAPAGIDEAAPTGLWGYSGGALASATAIQAQREYAPELTLTGTALGGVVADLNLTMRAFSNLTGVPPLAFAALNRSYPDANVYQYLNETARTAVTGAQNACVADDLLAHPLLRIEQLEAWPGAITDSPLSRLIYDTSPLGLPGTPTGPVLLYHAVGDEAAPIGPARQLAAKYCDGGAPVTMAENPVGEHVTEVLISIPEAIGYLNDRFAGKPAPSSC
ncbi:lipase family protein [Nocardia sp. XZ_19_385]|uniref:lipase family protein n=1 Tax=Nocardia sp. XZ_19_385 TaxID=2769488 RepID=UPI001E422605|nr:lipase family protein [Nocardia sp. XZ_19_385]